MIVDAPADQRHMLRPAAGWPRYMTVEDAKHLVFKLKRESGTGTVVQLVAACAGDGTSSLCRDIALVAAAIGLQVLLLDLGNPPGGQLAAFGESFSVQLAPGAPIRLMHGCLAVHQVGPSGLCIAAPDAAVDLLPPSAWSGLFDNVRGAFDLVVVDSAPLADAYDSVTRAQLADTTLIVVRAEKTRIAVVQNLQRRIADVGGHIGGILLNRRRFHVPGAVYRRV